MIKCPNCGSTAQVELLWRDNYSRTDYHEYDYKCGCGCEFEVRFEVVSVKIKEEE
jgi:predicted RNA-binding Zn-ribbon protein involved in translation (DUF1610 family)